MNARVLHQKALEIAGRYLSAESELIDILQRLDQKKAYRELGYRSLFEYSTEALKLSKDVAYNLISVARKAVEVPKLKEKISRQEVTLSNARTIAPVLTQENQAQWLLAAQSLSKQQLEKEVARVKPEAATPERARYVSGSRLKLELGVSEELHQKLKRAQDLISSKTKKAATIEETLEALVDLFLEKEDPLKKAQRAHDRRAKEEKTVTVNQPAMAPTKQNQDQSSPALLAPGQNFSPKSSKSFIPKRKAFPAQLQHALNLRDWAQCTHRNPAGQRCPERKWLDFHHRIPASQGGQDTMENLRTLCKAHHQMLHVN